MSNSTTITREQLRIVLLSTELGGKTWDSNHFSYAKSSHSTYSFGQMQFDVGKNPVARKFLQENEFSDDDIKKLSQHGGLSRTELNALDVKLQAVPQAKMDQFTNQQLDNVIKGVGDIVDNVRKQNPAAADAIANDPKLQLGIADYTNQFHPPYNQLTGFLAGKPEKLAGGTVQAGDTPSQEDIQKFINATGYGHDRVNAKAVESRAERFDEAMVTLKLSPATKALSHTSDKAGSVLTEGAHRAAIHGLQADLAKLGYTGGDGKPLKVDGHFGLDTRHAVERFQHDHHLEVDGKVGPKTWEALHALSHAHAKDVPLRLDDKQHPDHTLFQQTRGAVHQLDAQHGRAPDRHSDNLAAALVVAARGKGLTRIDQVLLSTDASRTFAVQGEPSSPFKQIAHVQTAHAVNTPLEQSSAAWQQVMQAKQAEQRLAPPLAPPHEQAALHAPSVISR